MYYQEALQNTTELVFQPYAKKSTSEIHEYIEPFFRENTPGIHILIICSPPDAPQINSDNIQNALSLENDPCEPLPLDGETPTDCTKRYFVVSPRLDDYVAVLHEVSRYAKCCYRTQEDFFSYPIRRSRDNLTHEDIASQLQSEISDALNVTVGHCHTLFVILSLPESFFEKVKAPETRLPNFFEYIVLVGRAEEALQALQEQLIEKDKENEELKKENTKLKKENTELREIVELTSRDRVRDDIIIGLTSYLHTLLIDGALSVDESNSLKQILDSMKKRDDLNDDMRVLIDEMDVILEKTIGTKKLKHFNI